MFWGILAIALCLVFFCQHPFLWKQDSKIAYGTSVSLNAESDYLVIVDESHFNPTPKTFPEMTFSLAWLNLFQQEIGPVALINASQFLQTQLEKYRAVIITRSAAGHDDWVPKIRTALERGATIVLEMPSGDLREIASADGKGGMRTPQSFTYANGMQTADFEALSTLNLSNLTKLVGSAGPLDNATTWLTIDGVPVIYEKKFASGNVITVDFDFAMLLTALQQGRPQDDFSLRSAGAPSTQDLARHENIQLPLADLLERFFIYGVLDKSTPVAGFWPFFDGMSGALLISMTENGTGDPAFWMQDYEHTFHAASTIFVDTPPAISETAVAHAEKNHSEIALAFDLHQNQPHTSAEPVGPFKFSPVWRQFNIDQQAQFLKNLLGKTSTLISAQSKNAQWTREYTRAFRMLTATGVRADASYQSKIDAMGFGFSTGLPFMPLDTNGKIFNILEFPVAFPKLNAQDDLAALENTLEQSRKTTHQAVSVTFDPTDYPQHPDFEKFQRWINTYQIASQNNHWITSLLNYLRFSRARFSAEIHSKIVDSKLNNKPVKLLKLELLAPENGMTVAVPKFIHEKSFSEARRGVQRIKDDALLPEQIQATAISVFGFERYLVALSKGFNAIDIIYE